MDISAKVTKLEGREPLMGLATVNFGNMVKVGSISIRKSKEGNIYIKMPSYKTNQVDENGKDVYKDVAFPVSKEAAAQIKQAVLDEYFGKTAEKQGRDYDFAELERDAVNPFDLGEEPKRTDFEYSCEILAAPQESGYETKEEDASIQGDDSLEIVDYPELKPSANQESYLLDVAQILNSDFSRSREPAVHGGIKKENKPFATSEENPSAVSASSHGLESVASTSKRRDLNNFVIGDVSQHKACRRQDPNKRLPIFRRFVDLATKRQQINAVDAEEIPVKRVETPTQDYSREICICDAYESANTIEVVVAPCYVGANVTFQNQ